MNKRWGGAQEKRRGWFWETGAWGIRTLLRPGRRTPDGLEGHCGDEIGIDVSGHVIFDVLGLTCFRVCAGLNRNELRRTNTIITCLCVRLDTLADTLLLCPDTLFWPANGQIDCFRETMFSTRGKWRKIFRWNFAENAE